MMDVQRISVVVRLCVVHVCCSDSDCNRTVVNVARTHMHCVWAGVYCVLFFGGGWRRGLHTIGRAPLCSHPLLTTPLGHTTGTRLPSPRTATAISSTVCRASRRQAPAVHATASPPRKWVCTCHRVPGPIHVPHPGARKSPD